MKTSEAGINQQNTAPNNITPGNGLERQIEDYKAERFSAISFKLILKPAAISFIALIFSFFLDLSNVPILGSIASQIALKLFPGSTPINSTVQPFGFWWVPLVVYSFFVLMAYLAYNKLRIELEKTPASETIDRVIQSYTSVMDSVATALPLIGAALLLISVNLGREVFQGLSVPFEIKALIVLALGKLFEPVLDQLGIEFQNMVTHINDMREKYFSQLQIENNNNLFKQLSQSQQGNISPEINLKDMEAYKTVLEHTYQLSNATLKNFANIHNILLEINKINAISPEKIEKLNVLAQSITQASKSLSDENTLTGLKHLETIVVRK